MKTIEYPVNPEIDKSCWPPGPWDDEPDKVQWEDEATGMPCLAVRNRMGAWCGYVGVPQGHPFHGVGYDGVRIGKGDLYEETDYPPSHYELTFSGSCMEGVPEAQGICHVVEPGEDDHVWWLGFDCAHGSDLIPGMMRFHEEFRHDHPESTVGRGETYKTLAYVKGVCAELAAWLKAAA
jgi:hypothetical protein